MIIPLDCIAALVDAAQSEAMKPRGGFRPKAEPWKKPCANPEHLPPNMLYIPPDQEYVHVCPGCGFTCVLQGSNVSL